MIKLHIIALIATFLIVNQVSSHQQFQRYIDHWNYLARIEGQFQKNHTLFQDAKCNPCDYLIIVYKDVIELLIDEPKEGNSDNVQAFEFTILDQHYNETWFDFDQQKYRLEKARGTIQSIQRLTKMGSQWVYELTLPIQGLILKGRSSLGHQYLIPIVTFIFSIAIGFAFPLTSDRRRQQSIEIPRRTPLICLLITSQLQHLLLIEIVVASIKYLIYEESFLAKSLWYIVYVTPFAFLILQIVYLYDSIRVRFWTDFEKVKNARFKDIGLLMSFFIGIYAATVLLLFLNKGMWVYAYFGIYLIWQIVQSIIRKTYPYLSMSAYFFALVGFQMFLADYEPLFWFQQLTRLQIVVFWGLMFGIFILGSFLQKMFIGIQIVNQVLFQESKNIEMGQAGSAKQTQSNLDP